MRRCLLIFFIVLSQSLTAQNLVPNPSFEMVDCPEDWMEPYSFGAMHWYNPNGSTPDYFGIEVEPGCYASILNDGWSDSGEWQYPSEGERMIGLVHYIHETCIREYVSVKLLEPLVAGEVYVASMKVSLSNTSSGATDGIAMYFSTDSLADNSTYCDFDIEPQVFSNSLVSDTTEWVLIEGEFVAQGGEQFLTIGNIRSNEWNVIESPYTDDDVFLNAYYFVDEVVVEPKVNTQVEDFVHVPSLQFYPVPATDQITCSTCETDGEVWIYTLDGKLCLRTKMQSMSVDISTLSRGHYQIRTLHYGRLRSTGFWKL